MDEITTTQDSPEQDTSGASEETTSQVKTFTEEEMQKRISDTLAQKGRDAKALEQKEAAIKAQEEANKAMSVEIERQRLEAQRREIEALADDPEAKKALLHKYDIENREREFEAKARAKEEAIQRMFSDAEALAIEYNLKPSDLLAAGNPEAMKLLAKNLALERELNTAKQAKGETPNKTDSGGGFSPDSGKSDAGGDSDEAFMKDYSAGKSGDHARAQKILAKIPNENLI